jgi:hypothetical protein
VFFYQSPYGGRVFFDELGPPWPKHPCTDNVKKVAEPKSINNPDSIAHSKRVYHWQVNGWLPYIISTVRQIDKYVVEIHGACGERGILLYISKSKLPLHDNPLHKESITQIRERVSGDFELSFITKDGVPYTINAYSLASQARPAYPSWPRVRRFTGPQPRTVSKGNRNMGKQPSLEGHDPVNVTNQDQAYPRLPNKSNMKNSKALRNSSGESRSDDFAKKSNRSPQPHRDTQIALAFAAALKNKKN